MKSLLAIFLVIASLLTTGSTAVARDGDTLEPVSLEAPALQIWPENLLDRDTFNTIQARVNESRNAGAPLAVRIVDISADPTAIPFQMRQYASLDLSQPLPESRQQAIGDAWMKGEHIETSTGANDGILLLVLVPADRANTTAVWWIGPNALPLNGLTEQNIRATMNIMDQEFDQGRVANGTFLGISEFGYNVQFGEPERLVNSSLQDALRKAVVPLALGTMAAGFTVPAAALWFSRKEPSANAAAEVKPIDAWMAATLHLGRTSPAIPAAMLMHAWRAGDIHLRKTGGIDIVSARNPATESLLSFADANGTVSPGTMREVEHLTRPVLTSLEREATTIGWLAPQRQTVLRVVTIACGFAVFMAALTIFPAVVSRSTIGVVAIVVAVFGAMWGWYWLTSHRFTTSAGDAALATWLESASTEDKALFDSVVNQHKFTDQRGGPGSSTTTNAMRHFRGLGAT